MLKKTITYTDYNGNERTEDFWFNISKVEAIEIQAEYNGDFEEMILRLTSEQDMKKIIEIFQYIVLKAYGQKSLDGRRFVKTPELQNEFAQTEAYVNLFMELAGNADEAARFIRGIMPHADEKSAAQIEATSLSEGK